MFIHDLVENAAFVAGDFSSEVDIEIFEGDSEQMGAMEGAKTFNAGRQRPMVVDPPQIGFNVHVNCPKSRLYTGSSSCIHPPAVSGLGSLARSRTSFSRTSRLPGGFERSARSAFATRRMARVSSRFDL